MLENLKVKNLGNISRYGFLRDNEFRCYRKFIDNNYDFNSENYYSVITIYDIGKVSIHYCSTLSYATWDNLAIYNDSQNSVYEKTQHIIEKLIKDDVLQEIK